MLTLTNVAVVGADEVLFACLVDDYSDEHPDHCLILRFSEGQFRQRLLDHAVAQIAVLPGPEQVVCFLGTGATSTFKGPAGFVAEVLDTSDDGASSRLLMRDALWSGRRLFACGMARIVYERIPAGGWRRIDAGVFLPRDQRDRAVGFHALACGPAGSLLFAGQYGEIWHLRSGQWTEQNSPTNVTLTDLELMSDGRVIATGMAGTVLIREGELWRALDTDVADDFWCVREFLGTAFLATSTAVYRLERGNARAGSAETSAAKLAAGHGRLWSVGPKDAYFTVDGASWTDVALPSTSS